MRISKTFSFHFINFKFNIFLFYLLCHRYPNLMRHSQIVGKNKDSALRLQCPKKGIPQCTPASLRYRTSDGSCNNLKELWWGSAMSIMQRYHNF